MSNKTKIIEMLEQNDFVSGAEMAKQLNIAPASLRRYIHDIREMGVHIDCDKSLGYGIYSLSTTDTRRPSCLILNMLADGKEYTTKQISEQCDIDLIQVTKRIATLNRTSGNKILSRRDVETFTTYWFLEVVE